MMTELYLEQVLIGALGIAIAVLPWLPEISDKLTAIQVEDALAIGSAAVGVAFWLGIPLDRLADTLTERLDRHARLRFALDRAKGTLFPDKTEKSGTLVRDLFEEDRLRVCALRDAEAAVKWLDYHRSRIRLTRALMAYGPALAVTLTIGLTRKGQAPREPVNPDWLMGIAIGYAIWAILASVRGSLPRTNELKFRDYAEQWNFIRADDPQIVKPETSGAAVWASEWLLLTMPVVLLGAALVLAFSRGDRMVELAAVGVASMTVMSAWAWWRIGFTFRTYLHDLAKYPNKPASASETIAPRCDL